MKEIEDRVAATLEKGDLVGQLRRNCEDAIRVLGEIQNDVKVDPKERMNAAEKNLKHYKDMLALRSGPTGLGDGGISALSESLTRIRGVMNSTPPADVLIYDPTKVETVAEPETAQPEDVL